MSRKVVVIDTNCWISADFFPNGIPARAVRIALEHYTIAYSKDTIDELEDVLSRSKFDRFAPLEERLSFTGSVAASGRLMEPSYQFHAC